MFWITVTTRHALYALTALAAGMIFISAFFFILEADFMGVVQLIVYSGAVMALYAFGMMFYDTTRELHEKQGNNTLVFLLSGISALIVVAMVAAPLVGNLTPPRARMLTPVVAGCVARAAATRTISS